MSAENAFLQELMARGLIQQKTSGEEFDEHLSLPRVVYCGFDPTADSLHIGSLVPLLMLRRFQQAGHTPIAVVGGATGLIGDPSFKSKERQLNTGDIVANWVQRLRQQIERFVEFSGDNAALLVNNLDWTQDLDVLSFLRDVGKHFSISTMIQKEAVKQRINREGEGISFTEFSYILLQSMDFAELYHRHQCTVQIGGSDQWGNITGGTDLCRRQYRGQVFGMTMPLVTKSDGTKFGKTESGTIWLDAKKTSPYAFYQFWLGTPDVDVYRYLKYFTFLSVADIDAIEEQDRERQGRPLGQSVLADEVTAIVHGKEGLEAAKRITDALFSGSDAGLSEEDFEQLALDGLSCERITLEEAANKSLMQLLTDAGLVSSGKQIKDALSRKAVIVNGKPLDLDDNLKVASIFEPIKSRYEKYFLVRVGKKKHMLIMLDYQ